MRSSSFNRSISPHVEVQRERDDTYLAGIGDACKAGQSSRLREKKRKRNSKRMNTERKNEQRGRKGGGWAYRAQGMAGSVKRHNPPFTTKRQKKKKRRKEGK